MSLEQDIQSVAERFRLARMSEKTAQEEHKVAQEEFEKIQKRIRSGETTGDKTRDFVLGSPYISFYDQEGHEKEKQKINSILDLNLKKGDLVLLERKELCVEDKSLNKIIFSILRVNMIIK